MIFKMYSDIIKTSGMLFGRPK